MPRSGLVPGMAVTDAQGTSHGVITAVASDNKTITLSQAQSGALFDDFNFAKPDVSSIVGYDPTGLTPIKTFTFAAGQQNYALAFAQNVYVVMSTMGLTVKSGTANASIPLLGNIIGGNVGPAFLPEPERRDPDRHHEPDQVGLARGAGFYEPALLKPIAVVSRSGPEDWRPELQRL